jgi:ADP-ribosyl-[dinitrogen reductase] hydrolase
MSRRDSDHYSGCLLGGAVGDALGGPVEFFSLNQIRQQFGPNGVQDYVELNERGLAEFTDDTQMTLFTAEGLLLARQRGNERGIWDPTEGIYRGYQRWLRTQRTRPTGPTGELTREGWLLGIKEMWKIKAPAQTCLSALSSGRAGTFEKPANDSKGCGGIMRVAPIGLAFEGESAFTEAAEAAALTHGHPTGYLTAGVLAQTIAEIVAQPLGIGDRRRLLEEAVQTSISTLAKWPGHGETLYAVQYALELAGDPAYPPAPETVEMLGTGWVAEEALAIGLYCALVHTSDFSASVLLAVNHSGDSDSTGSICGNLLGAVLGARAISPHWLDQLELRAEIERIANELLG